MPKNYHEPNFWEERYIQNVCQHYQWLHHPNDLQDILKLQIGDNYDIKILQLGCGTSLLSQKLYSMGYRNIKAIDFSKQVIKNRQRRQKQNNKGNIEYVYGNILDIKQENQTYDLIIQKCTIDCLFCSKNLLKSVLTCLRQCYRILKQNGKLIIISQSKPRVRRFLFRNKLVPFQLKYYPIKIKANPTSSTLTTINQNLNYIYICKKSKQINQQDNTKQLYEDNQKQNYQENNEDNQEINQNQQEEKKQQQNQQENQQNYQDNQDENKVD